MASYELASAHASRVPCAAGLHEAGTNADGSSRSRVSLPAARASNSGGQRREPDLTLCTSAATDLQSASLAMSLRSKLLCLSDQIHDLEEFHWCRYNKHSCECKGVARLVPAVGCTSPLMLPYGKCASGVGRVELNH